MFFEIISDLTEVVLISKGKGVRSRNKLQKKYGLGGTWRKMKGRARVKLPTGELREAEVHWYEAHGIGKKDFKIKKFLD